MNLEELIQLQRKNDKKKRSRYFNNEKFDIFLRKNDIRNQYIVDHLGLSRGSISQWRKDKNPSFAKYIELVELLKLPYDFFIRPIDER